MGKAHKTKGELIDAVEMVDLVQTLKDIADNKFYTLINQKYKFRRFGESFVEFFRLISLTKEGHPLLANTNKTVGVLAITIDGSFLGQFNNKIIRLAVKQKEKYEKVRFLGVGNKSIDRLKDYDPDPKIFSSIEMHNLYDTAVEIKNYLVDEVMNDRLGKVIVAYSWPKSFEVSQPRLLQLLPCEDLVSKQAQMIRGEFEHIIEESSPREIIGFLTNLWITTRLFEILMDTFIASAAAQANFLDDAVDKMKKERDKVRTKFRKAKKEDIDKSLRETFSARMMTMKS